MTRMLLLLLVLLVLAGCSVDREERAGWTLHAVEGTCAPSEDARAALLEAWGTPVSRIDGMPCTLEEVLSIDEPKTTSVDSCCYAVTCSSELSPVEELTLYDATCRTVACNLEHPTNFTPADVTQQLAAKLPRCTLDASQPAPVTRSTLQCVYSVNARYSCSTAPG